MMIPLNDFDLFPGFEACAVTAPRDWCALMRKWEVFEPVPESDGRAVLFHVPAARDHRRRVAVWLNTRRLKKGKTARDKAIRNAQIAAIAGHELLHVLDYLEESHGIKPTEHATIYVYQSALQRVLEQALL